MKLRLSIPKFSLYFSTILFVAYLITSAMVYYGNGDSMGTIQLGLSLVTIGIYFKHKKTIKVMPWLLLTMFALILLFFSGQMSARGFNAPIKHTLKFVHVLYAFTAFIFIRYIAKEGERRFFVICMLFVTALSCFRSLSLVLSSGNAYAIRYASRYGYESDVVGFYQIFAIPFYVVIVFYLLQNIEKKKLVHTVLLLGVLASYLYFTAIALFTTALILTIIGILLFYLFKALRGNRSVFLIGGIAVFILLFLVIAVFPTQTMDIILNATQDFNYVIRNRLLYVAESILNVSAGISYNHERREELASYSLQTFKNHPLFGVGYSGYGYGVIGCHQEWYDMLGVFGLIGSVVVFAVLIGLFVKIYRDLDSRNEKDLFIILSGMFVLLGFLNPCLSDPLLIALFVVVPNLKFLTRSAGGDQV